MDFTVAASLFQVYGRLQIECICMEFCEEEGRGHRNTRVQDESLAYVLCGFLAHAATDC